MPWKARSVTLSDKQHCILSKIAVGRSSRQHHIQRAKIILMSADGLSNSKISSMVCMGQQQISKWRNRWADNEEALLQAEKNAKTHIEFERFIESLLSDAPRSGAPPKFTEEQICQIYALATEKPEDSDLPLSHWSLSSLAAEAIKRGIVDSISLSHLHDFLKSSELKTS